MLPERPSAARKRPSTSPNHICTVNRARRMLAKLITSSCFGPAADQIVIEPGQPDNFRVIAHRAAQSLNGGVEFEEIVPCLGIANHALHPEEGRPAAAAVYPRDMMAAGGGIKHQVARRQLDLVAAEPVFDHQLTAVIVGRIGEEQGCRQVGANPYGI